MRRGWTLLHENDCYLCEPFWGMQVAVANAEAGQLESGLEILRELIAWTEQSGQHWLDAELHRSRGELWSRLGPPGISPAEEAFRKALEIAQVQQAKTFALRSAVGLARLYSISGWAASISEVLAPILADFDTGQDLPEIGVAAALLCSAVRARPISRIRFSMETPQVNLATVARSVSATARPSP